MLRRLRAAPARSCCTGASDRQPRERQAQGLPLPVTCTAGMPASGRDTWPPLPSAIASCLCIATPPACCRVQAASLREEGHHLERCSCSSWTGRYADPVRHTHTMRTLRAHHVRCAGMHVRRPICVFARMCRRARAAGGPGEQKCSPGDCRPVRRGAPCCVDTHGELWAREVCALWPMAWSLDSVGVGSCAVSFSL